jgi:hypothetical protein
MQLLEADLELGRKIRDENCGPELSPAQPVVGLIAAKSLELQQCDPCKNKPTRVRESTLKALARALDVRPESLCPTAEAEREVMKLRIETASSIFLQMIARLKPKERLQQSLMPSKLA